MPNRVVHFEIEAKDKERAKKFYAQAFDWEMDQQGKNMGGYIVVKTGETTGKLKDMGINGGIFQREKKELNAYSCVIGVEDIDKTIKDIKAAGGKVYDDNKTPDGKPLGEKMDIPGVGIYAKCDDPEGNRFTLLQPSPDMIPKS
jgi:predicted enzyme related to lactoylglutathione lyase